MYIVELDGDDDVFFHFRGDPPRTYLKVLTNDVVKLLTEISNVHVRYASKDYAQKELQGIIDSAIKEFSKRKRPQNLNLGGNYSISISTTEPEIPHVIY